MHLNYTEMYFSYVAFHQFSLHIIIQICQKNIAESSLTKLQYHTIQSTLLMI